MTLNEIIKDIEDCYFISGEQPLVHRQSWKELKEIAEKMPNLDCTDCITRRMEPMALQQGDILTVNYPENTPESDMDYAVNCLRDFLDHSKFADMDIKVLGVPNKYSLTSAVEEGPNQESKYDVSLFYPGHPLCPSLKVPTAYCIKYPQALTFGPDYTTGYYKCSECLFDREEKHD